jgi:hypothetical protein
MKRMLALVAICGLGTVATLPAMADDDYRGRRDDRYERRHDDRSGARHGSREQRYARAYHGRGNGYSARYAPRYVVSGRYCDDHRHYRDVHYHVPARDYYRNDYPRASYWLHGASGRGIDATLVLTLPLF